MFQLMNKDNAVATFTLKNEDIAFPENINVLGTLPIGCTEGNLYNWLRTRHASKHRRHLLNYLENIQCANIYGFLKLTHGISINDCFWVKDSNEDISWRDVSPYSNDFDEVIQALSFDGRGLYGEALSSTSPEFGTSGAFDKCWKRKDSDVYLYKRGSDIASNSGLEPYCEVLASQIFVAMNAGIPYDLVHFRGKVASCCKLFNNEQTSFIAYANVTTLPGELPNALKFYSDINCGDLFKRLIICDAITLNVDRHTGNHGVLYDADTCAIKCMALGFDYNLALLPYVTRDQFSCVSEHINKALPKTSDKFIPAAKYCMTPEIRNDLLKLRGITLKLPFTDERFPQERVNWMTDIVNHQIDNILYKGKSIYPTFKVDGLSNLYKYKLKHNLTEDALQEAIPGLCKKLGVSHMTDLEEKLGSEV